MQLLTRSSTSATPGTSRNHGAPVAATPVTANRYSHVGGRKLLINTKMAFSGASLMRLRTTYTNWPTVKSAGTKYLAARTHARTRTHHNNNRDHHAAV